MTRFQHSDLGAVAAGHEDTAAAGLQVLERGGNAVDAIVAMMFASVVVEGTLTSFGGGGFLLVDGPELRPALFDFFVRQPGFGAPRTLSPWESFVLPLDGKDLHFGTGPASVAVPGMAQGIADAAARFGKMPLTELARPAAELATSGVVLTHTQAVEHALNAELLTRNADGPSIYLDTDGTPRPEGAIFRQPLLAASIEEIAATQARTFVDGSIAKRLVQWSDERGGRISAEDLAAFSVRHVEPIELDLGDVRVYTNPRPSMGGVIIEHLLAAMLAPEQRTSSQPRDERIAPALMQVLRELKPPLTVPPVEGAHVETGIPDDGTDEAVSRMTPDRGGDYAGSPNTTHISAVDSDGMFAAATTTIGYGSGEYIPGTGIQLNNVLAEYDHTARRPAGATVPSMMAPTMLHGPTATVAIGSAGSDRIPQAIAQILVRMWEGSSLPDAISAPRIVFDGHCLHAEPGFDDATLAALRADVEVTAWSAPNAYFGTSNAVAIRNGELQAHGDTRREAVGRVMSAR